MKTCVLFCAAEFDSLVRPLGENDHIIAMSDGCPHAGIGMSYNFGWKREEIITFMEALAPTGLTAKNMAKVLHLKLHTKKV